MGIFDRDLWSEVFSTLTKNMLRTFLTTLGVIFAIVILILFLINLKFLRFWTCFEKYLIN